MANGHEYAILGGYNRAKVGRYLAHFSATLSAAFVFVLLSAVNFAKHFGVSVNLPPIVMSLLGAASIYGILYWAFDNYAWRVVRVSRFLNVPNLAGTWRCDGVSEDKQPPVPWTGQVVIVQSWDKIRIHLQTAQSSSDSVAAALLDDSPVGFKLMYHYKNLPKPGEPADLAAHHGFAELTFSADGATALGGYFNGRGRGTHGTMRLTKEAN